jgi:uncharacterized protein (TIGR03546 family)
MILPGFISKVLAAIRGGISPALIFLSFFFGFWFGMIPGFSGIHAVLIVVILLLNIPIGFVIFSGALGRALCYAAAPILYHSGLWMQGNIPAVFRFLESLPVIGVTDFARYSVCGGFILGPIVGIIAGLLMAGSVIRFRRMMLRFEEGSEAFKKWYSNRWVHILDRVLIGKRTRDAKSLFIAKTKYVRKAGVVLAVLAVAAVLITANFLKSGKFKSYAVNAMTQVNGAEVDLNDIGLSILNGQASASGIQVTDPENPRTNQLTIGKVAANTNMYDLLLGKVVMDKVEVSGVRFNQQRSTPGNVVQTKAQPSAPFDPCAFKLGPGSLTKLETYVKDAKAWKEKLQKLSKYLPSSKGTQAAASPEKAPQKFLEYLTARAAVLASPRIMAKDVLLGDVQIPSELFGKSKIELKNLSDSPQAAKLPISFNMISLKTKALLDAKIDYSTDVPHLTGTFKGFDMSQIQSGLSGDTGITFKSGVASGEFSGTITKESVDLAVQVDISDLKAAGQGKGVLGLGPEVTNESLGLLQNLKTTIRVVGPVTEPRLVFDVKGLTDEFKQALAKAGKDRLIKEIDDRVGKKLGEKLGDKVPGEIKDAIGKPKDLIEGLGGLLGGQDKKQQ